MKWLPSSPSPPPLELPPPPLAEPYTDPGFDPIEEWLVDLDLDLDCALLLGDAAMAGHLGPQSSDFGAKEADLDASEQKGCDLGVVLDGSMSKSCDFGVKEVVEMEKFDGEGAALGAVRYDFHVKEEVEMGNDGLGEEFGPNETKDYEILCGSVSTSGDLVVKEEVSEGIVDAEMTNMSSVKELDGGPSGGKGDDEESSEEESEESESSDDDDDESSSEASLSSEEEEEKGGKKDGGRGGEKDDEMKDVEACLEEGEMVGSDEEEAPKGPIRSKHEVEVCPPVPKVEVQLEPHHQTLPVGTISAIMGEKVIVEGSVQHNPLNEGSILWISERTPLGIVDEIFGPVKNPYYLVRYNSEKEVPTGISVGTAVSFVMEFADHILNMKELYRKGYDASGENDEELTDEPEFSDDEKEAEYRRSLRQAKRQTNHRQHEPQKPFVDKKRTRPKGAGSRKEMAPMIPNAPAPGRQPQPHFHGSDMVLAVTDNAMRSLGAQNFSMGAPAMGPQVPTDPAMSSAVQLAAQMGSCFVNPPQQFLRQQPNAVWPNGLPPQQQQNMGIEGTLAANVLQNLLIGANQYQQQFQNQNFGGFPNRMPVPSQQQFMHGGRMPAPSQQQFMPGGGMPANSLLVGGQLVNPLFGAPSPVPMLQGNFGQVPYGSGNMPEQGFGQLPPPHRNGEQAPMQFNSGQFNHGNSSFRGRRPHQRGGRHFFGRGARNS